MNLYDAYMTSRDRADFPPELREVLAPVPPRPGMPTPPTPPVRPPEPPRPPMGGSACRFPSLAMVYAPLQSFREMYSPEEGLSRGTLFRELDKPLEVAGGRRKG